MAKGKTDKKSASWDRIAKGPAFKELVAQKKRFIVPACIFFIAYYFALPVLVGFAPGFMSTPVFGKVNLAYLFALSQFFMAWGLAALYVKEAASHDRQAHSIASGKKTNK